MIPKSDKFKIKSYKYITPKILLKLHFNLPVEKWERDRFIIAIRI